MEAGSPPQEENGTLSDAPGGAGAPGAGIFSLGQRMLRIGVGTVFLGLDQAHALLEQAVRRGEQVEADAQRAAASLRQRTADAAHGAVSSASRRSTVAWSSGLASMMNKLPGVSLTYKPPESASDPTGETAETQGNADAVGEEGRKSVAQVSINDFDPNV
jgi:hypothetical protein